jgi:hypothetical protein
MIPSPYSTAALLAQRAPAALNVHDLFRNAKQISGGAGAAAALPA